MEAAPAMIAQVENAILARLKAAADAGVLGYKWGKLDRYPEDWDLSLTEKFKREPAAWVVFGGWRSDEHTSALQSQLRTLYAVLCLEQQIVLYQQRYITNDCV